LSFRTGFITPNDMAAGIRELKDNNCDIIVDDITHITEPFLKDGAIAQAVNEVSSQGVAYFSAAGNFADKSYQNTFVAAPAPSGLAGSAHNFSGGDIYQKVKLKKGVYTIVLQWQDSIYSLGQTQNGGTQNDMDIYLTSNNGVTLFGYNRNNFGGDPIEIFPFSVSTDSVEADILIVKAFGSSTNLFFKYIIFRGDGSILEHKAGSSTIVGQANADSAFTVGAVRYTKTPVYGTAIPEIETFSSHGGTPVNGVIRNKPDFTAPDGVNTSVNFNSLNIEGDQLPNFFGTSAAAPHAAAAAALLMQARKRYYSEDLSVGALRGLLKSSALDMGAPGPDFISGHGLL
jgi:Subtilase family